MAGSSGGFLICKPFHRNLRTGAFSSQGRQTPRRGLEYGGTGSEGWTPAHSTSPNSCSTDLVRGKYTVQGKRARRTAEEVAGVQVSASQENAHKHKSFWLVTPQVRGESPGQVARGHVFTCYPQTQEQNLRPSPHACCTKKQARRKNERQRKQGNCEFKGGTKKDPELPIWFYFLSLFRKRGGIQKSMGKKVPCKTGVRIYLAVTSRPLISLAEDAVLSPCNFRDHPFDSLHSEFISPLNFATHETEDPSQRPNFSRGCMVCFGYERAKTRGLAQIFILRCQQGGSVIGVRNKGFMC